MALARRVLCLGLFTAFPAWATPSLSDLTSALERQQMLLDDAHDLRIATSRVENDIAQRLRAGSRECDDYAGHLARIAQLGPIWRDALQAARVQQGRIDEILLAPSVSPLIDTRFNERTDTFNERLVQEVQLYQVSTRWLQTDIKPRIAWCEPELVAQASPPGDETVAWVIAWMGTVCADDGAGGTRAINITDTRAVRISPPIACWSAQDCDCVPDLVTTGSALGPQP